MATPSDDGMKLNLTLVMSQPIVGISFLCSFLVLGIYFYYFIGYFGHHREKQISWLLTLASSVTCTLVSFFFFPYNNSSEWWWFFGDDDPREVKDSLVDTSLVCFFIAYLIMDLSMGWIYYRSRLSWATGWLHHLMYIMVLVWLLQCRSCSFFTIHARVELPTVILAMGVLYPPWRSDWLFAILFFLFRIVYHLLLIYSLHVHPHHRLADVWIVALMILPLHLYWFHAIVCGLLQKKKRPWPSKYLPSTKKTQHGPINIVHH